jgi:hypothetical protein
VDKKHTWEIISICTHDEVLTENVPSLFFPMRNFFHVEQHHKWSGILLQTKDFTRSCVLFSVTCFCLKFVLIIASILTACVSKLRAFQFTPCLWYEVHILEGSTTSVNLFFSLRIHHYFPERSRYSGVHPMWAVFFLSYLHFCLIFYFRLILVDAP